MKRLQFILSTLAATIAGLIGNKCEASLAGARKTMTWAEQIALESARTQRRRYEHLLHAKYCDGGLDHLSSREEVSERQARCAKICGLCRYINSLAFWPNPNYRRPPENFLEALEEQPWCLTWRTEAAYKKIPRV